jgi:CTP synthase
MDNDSSHAVINLMADQKAVEDKGGTMRLGAYDCKLRKDSLAHKIYGKTNIKERHRHRYEFNNEYLKAFEEGGMQATGINPANNLVEIIELPDHPFFIGVQFHPELKSTVMNPHPLFVHFVKAAMEYSAKKRATHQ